MAMKMWERCMPSKMLKLLFSLRALTKLNSCSGKRLHLSAFLQYMSSYQASQVLGNRRNGGDSQALAAHLAEDEDVKNDSIGPVMSILIGILPLCVTCGPQTVLQPQPAAYAA